jgi:hypothetical protein
MSLTLPKLPTTTTQEAGTATIEIPLVTIRKDVLAKQRKQLFAAGATTAFAVVAFVSHYGHEPKASAVTSTPTTVIAAQPASK